MSTVYRLAADVVVVVHLAYVLFVVLGQAAILVGWWRGWTWIRQRVFRVVHLLAITIVVAESLWGITCPLTTWEHEFRRRAGEATYAGDFVGRLAHDFLFFDARPEVFTAVYVAFGLTVLVAFVGCPPRWKRGDPVR